MRKTGSKSFRIVLIALLILSAVGIIWGNYYSPAAKQSQNLVIADKFIAQKLLPIVKKNDKFKNIKLGHYTGNGGCIWILGIVETKKDLEEFKKIVKSSNYPLEVKWNVKVWTTLIEQR